MRLWKVGSSWLYGILLCSCFNGEAGEWLEEFCSNGMNYWFTADYFTPIEFLAGVGLDGYVIFSL